MPGIDDWTFTPHRMIDRIFEECGPGGPWRDNVNEYFERELSQQTTLKKLPWLNETPLHQLRPNQLVRYRGMVQDMFNNEFYPDVYQVQDSSGKTRLQAGRYRDITECGVGESIVLDGKECVTEERLVYYCVPIPGESDWVKQIYQERNPTQPEASTSTPRPKRPAGEESDSGEGAATIEPMECMDDNASASTNTTNKRTKVESESPTVTAQNGEPTSVTTTSTSTPTLNFPLPGMTGTPCLVKMYGNQNFSLNKVVEVVGILSVDPALAPTPGQNDSQPRGMEVEEEAVHSPPPSLVPRLHVLSAHSLPHTNPLLPDVPPELCQPRESRETLRRVLNEACLGDDLAAEFLICNLISSVYSWKDVVPLGKFSMNLSGIRQSLQDQEYTNRLYSLLSRLITLSHCFPMTLSTMNSNTIIPRKDYDANRLVTGILQLPEHLHLVLDETRLTNGQLDAQGVHNVTALGNLINWQKVDYDFRFYKLEQHANVPVLILSEGRSMITCDLEVKLEPQHSDVSGAFNRVEALLTPETLTDIRTYITTIRLHEYSISQAMQKMVQDEFVESRKTDEGISADDLHRFLVLAKYVAVSCGELTLNADVWRSAKILEQTRKARLNQSDN
ncbi:hypothetical protein Pmani_034464 [Petrolisthes manimaculis]|uniref:Mini-chromosome maintenance complex-binding protein n=1 Tax=Petrolisthes manimaculis TaxID=1843537 RepID=A0AAE1NMP5_9EUCA|nr:hypothetical protein Pmani_034464 [Petrolisthes manimaculis]